jgi:hypothetical protein
MDRTPSDRDLRDLLLSLRDTFKEAAARIDDALGAAPAPAASGFRRDDDRRPARDFNAPRDVRAPRDFGASQAYRGDNRDNRGPQREFQGNREPRDFRPEDARARWIPWRQPRVRPGRAQPPGEAPRGGPHHQHDAPGMDPSLLRLKIEAVTAETRVLQPRINDPEDNDIAAKIMRSLTAIVSEHRPGHVYGLARHHQADWNDVSRRARDELRALEGQGGADAAHAPKGEPDLEA